MSINKFARIGYSAILCLPLVVACSEHQGAVCSTATCPETERIDTERVEAPMIREPANYVEPASYAAPAARIHTMDESRLRRITENLQSVDYQRLEQDRYEPSALGTMRQVANDVNALTNEAERMNTAVVSPAIARGDETE